MINKTKFKDAAKNNNELIAFWKSKLEEITRDMRINSVLENDFKTSIEVEENMFNIHIASQ